MISPMKSAYELAMSRLEKESPSKPVDEATRAALAEADSEYTAKIAERKIFLEGELAKTSDPSEAAALRRQISTEIARLEDQRESKKERIRNGRD